MLAKSSPLDKIPTSVVKSCVDSFAPLIDRLVARSFNEGKFSGKYRQAWSRCCWKRTAWTKTFSETPVWSQICTLSRNLSSEFTWQDSPHTRKIFAELQQVSVGVQARSQHWLESWMMLTVRLTAGRERCCCNSTYRLHLTPWTRHQH
jgi:hypothetical protein